MQKMLGTRLAKGQRCYLSQNIGPAVAGSAPLYYDSASVPKMASHYLVKMTTSAGYCSFKVHWPGGYLNEISKTQLSSINPLTISSSFKEKSYHRHLSATQQTSVHMHPSAGNYSVQNRIIASRWTCIHWYQTSLWINVKMFNCLHYILQSWHHSRLQALC